MLITNIVRKEAELRLTVYKHNEKCIASAAKKLPLHNMEPVQPDSKILIEMVQTKMPFGKYKGTLICDLPVYYLEWMHSKGGFPPGKMGMLLSSAYEIKINGLNTILRNVKAALNNGEL